MATNKATTTKVIDIKDTKATKTLTLIDLINDAVARQDKEALEWLQDESAKTTERTKSDGTKFTVGKTIIAIRSEYLKKFLGYKPNSGSAGEAAAKAKAKKDAEREALFAEAFKKLN